MNILVRSLFGLSLAIVAYLQVASSTIEPAKQHGFELHLQTRDAKSGTLSTTAEQIDPKTCGVVIVDMWNYHWCMTAAQRVASMAPRMNRALEGARKLGMTVIWAPTDVADLYVGQPQRERAMAVVSRPPPHVRDLPWHGTLGGGCICGPGISCETNYGWDGMNPDLHIAESDYIVGADADEMHALCTKLGLTNLIYMGVHTNMCVLGKGPAIKNMYDSGLRCFLARDLTDALTHYDPQTGFTPDGGTAKVVTDLERSDVPSVNMADELRTAGLWQNDWITEPVRITPWGSEFSPYQFRGSPVTVTLSAPWLDGAEIHYTLDGSEPSATSALYSKPFPLDATTTVRATAFRDGHRVSVPSSALFVKLSAATSSPEIPLDTLKPYSPPSGRPENNWPLSSYINRSFDGQPISIRGQTYEKGLVARAPAGIRYDLKPNYERFVARVGVDDISLRMRDHASFIGKHAGVIFKIYVDGQPAFTTPKLRLGQEPFPIDLELPAGARQIHLVIVPAEEASQFAVGAIVNAGFVSGARIK